MKRIAGILALLVVASACLAQTGRSSFFGFNLLHNGDAEAGPTDPAPSWFSDGKLAFAAYGRIDGEWAKDVKGAPIGGCCYLRLVGHHAEQTVDTTPGAEAIDDGRTHIVISGYLGALKNGKSSIRITIEFIGEDRKLLGGMATDWIRPESLPDPEVGSAVLVAIRKEATVPKGTRNIRFLFENQADSRDDLLGFADNLALVLLTEPKP